MAIIHTMQYARTPVIGKIKIRHGKPVYEPQSFDEELLFDRILSSRKLGLFVAETTAREMNEYVPMETGMLSQNYITEPYKVTYTSVYAHRQFNGDEFNFSKEMHPNATAHWDKATQDAKTGKIARQVTAFLRRG